MTSAPVVVGSGSLPLNVPESSVSTPSTTKLAELVEEGDGSFSLAANQRAVANDNGKDFGLEVKVSSHALLFSTYFFMTHFFVDWLKSSVPCGLDVRSHSPLVERRRDRRIPRKRRVTAPRRWGPGHLRWPSQVGRRVEASRLRCHLPP